MESQSITSLVALDLSAAFDTVDHDILLSILSSKYGIKGVTLKWFDQYLRPRSFRVTVNGVCSKDRDLTVSVPQGSCARGQYLQPILLTSSRRGTQGLTIKRFC